MSKPDVNATFLNEGAEAARSWQDNAQKYSSAAAHDDAELDAAAAASEAELATVFTEQHAHELRYVSLWGRWLKWNGTHWRFEDTLLTFDLCRAVCVEASSRRNRQGNMQKYLASAKTIAAVERLARADRQHAATADQWDADPWLLNTPGGVIDLRSGSQRAHRPDDYITRIAGTHFDSAMATPIWTSFLEKIFGGDQELIDFMQRMVGYGLTGSTAEHALFFLHGTGANGKSVFVNTISGIMADYHKTAPIETFTASSQERHPTDLAGLRGARFVTAIETEEGRRWAESRIKALTGGDPISARFMRQDFFEFTPQFKLVIAGNHKPGLRSVDEAIRRRFNLVPFTVTIPTEDRDKDLTTKLKTEWPGILAWIIEGCLAWHSKGLAAPQAVIDATADYLESEDAMNEWLEDCCFREPQSFTASDDLFRSWNDWAERSGEHVGSKKRFTQSLETRGFRRQRTEIMRGFVGLALRPCDHASSTSYSQR